MGVHLPANREAPAEAALLLGFGGNTWDADRLAIYPNSVFPTRNVVTFHCRGYGPSAGRPSTEAFLEEATRIYDEVGDLRDAERVVAIGLSLGSGPAAHLAGERAVDGLILVTPFDSPKPLRAISIRGSRSASCCGTEWTWQMPWRSHPRKLRSAQRVC